MKTSRLLAAALLAALILPVTLRADTEIVDGIEWTYTVSDGKASVGGGSYTSKGVPQSTTGAITIPSTLGGYPVTSIGDQAFIDCSSLTSVTIPDSVTSIEEYAFYGCSGLTSVTIGDSVTSIGEDAFYGCSGLTSFIVAEDNPNYSSINGLLLSKDGKTLIRGVNGDVTIPDSVTRIGSSAFSGCSGLTSVTIGSGVTSIGGAAFAQCPNLSTVTILSGAARFEGIVFEDCSSLKTVHISRLKSWLRLSFYDESDNPLHFARRLFVNGVEVKDLVIPDSVTSIGDYAFSGCSGLKSVTIPNSVTNIGSGAFSDCSGLTSVTIPNSVTNIGYEAFRNCSGLTSVTIPNSVTSMGENVFDGCKKLTKISLPKFLPINRLGTCPAVVDGRSSSGYKYFYLKGCDWCQVTSLPVNARKLPATLDKKKVVALNNSNGRAIGDFTIPNGVESIGASAFDGCQKLTAISIPKSLKRIGTGAFGYYYHDSSPFYDDVDNRCPLEAVYITDLAAWCAIQFEHESIPLSLPFFEHESNPLSIAHRLYLNKKEVRQLAIPSGVTRIEDCSFQGASRVTSLSIPSSARSIGAYAFADCSTLASASLPNSVENMGDYAFSGCGKLKSIVVPGVRKIGKGTFKDCASLASVILSPGVEIIEGPSFIPGHWDEESDSDDPWWVGDGWGSDGAFSGCYKLQSLTIPASVTNIGEQAFADCAQLKELVLPVCFKGRTGNLGIPAGCAVRFVSACTIRFNPNGGSGSMAAMTSKPKKKVTLRANKFKRKGYGFFGWSRKPSGPVAYKNKWQGIPKNGKGKQLVAGETLDLYAFWAKPTYKVAFYANGGKGKMAAQTMTYGKAKKLTANKFARKGYVFKGWAKSKALAKKGTVAYKNKKAVKNLVTNGKTVKLYAVWKKK